MSHPHSVVERRVHCCGPSEARTADLVRYRCAECGEVIARDSLNVESVGLYHNREGSLCGLVHEQRATSHAEYVRWLMGG